MANPSDFYFKKNAATEQDRASLVHGRDTVRFNSTPEREKTQSDEVEKTIASIFNLLNNIRERSNAVGKLLDQRLKGEKSEPIEDNSRRLMQEHIIATLREYFEKVCKTNADRRDFLAELGSLIEEFYSSDLLAPEKPQEEETDLPTQAPALWLERENRKETPPEFIKREYAPWLGRGLTQAHIRRLDKSLYMALHKWLQSHDWPADLDLPTRKELNDRQLAAAGLPADPAQADARSREQMRLNAMAQARLFRADRR